MQRICRSRSRIRPNILCAGFHGGTAFCFLFDTRIGIARTYI